MSRKNYLDIHCYETQSHNWVGLDWSAMGFEPNPDKSAPYKVEIDRSIIENYEATRNFPAVDEVHQN